MTLEPCHNVGMFVGAVVVEDDMDHLAGRHLALDGVEKANELLLTVLFACNDRLPCRREC